MPARVQFTRAAGTQGKVRLKLLTSQPTPKKTVKENNQDKVVDDIDRLPTVDRVRQVVALGDDDVIDPVGLIDSLHEFLGIAERADEILAREWTP